MRGLKYHPNPLIEVGRKVAPHMGAWIEIGIYQLIKEDMLVAPHMGAWIEIA